MSTSCNSSLDDDEEFLPEDLVTEILLLLPIKSLLRFKSVCKRWKSIITSSKFASLHLQSLNQHLPSFLVVRSDYTTVLLNASLNPYGNISDIVGKFVPISPKFLLDDCLLDFLGTCHGLVCVHLFDNDKLCKFYVWNPAINQFREIKFRLKYPIVRRVDIGGFGYDPFNKDYKIILVILRDAPRVSTIFVYSLRNDRWKELALDSSKSIFPSKNTTTIYWDQRLQRKMVPVQLNESLYWVVDSFIVKFDLVNEVFERVSNLVDHGILDYGRYWSLQKCIGVTMENKLCLSLLKLKRYRDPYRLEMWVMDDERNDRWKPLYNHQGSFRDIGDDHGLLGVAFNCRVLVMEKKNTNMEVSLVFDARQLPPLFVHSSNEYCPPYKPGESIQYVVGYDQTLVSPFNI